MKLDCWKCGQRIDDLPKPLGRREECPACHSDLHCCRQCSFYDTSAPDACREPIADAVRNKERANFCGYFTLNPSPQQGLGDPASEQAKAELAALFGDAPTTGDAAKAGEDEAERARRELESLFGLNEPPAKS